MTLINMDDYIYHHLLQTNSGNSRCQKREVVIFVYLTIEGHFQK